MITWLTVVISVTKWLGLMLGQSLATWRGSLKVFRKYFLKDEILWIPFIHDYIGRFIRNAMQKNHIENFDHLASRPSQSLLLLFTTEFSVSN